MNIEFLSRYQFKKHIKEYGVDKNTAYISINDTPAERTEIDELIGQANCDSGTCASYLALVFADNEGQHGCMEFYHAMIIVNFVKLNKNKDFIVHCFAGVSRSAAIAKFINDYYAAGDWWLDEYCLYNRYVYNKLMSQTGKSLESYYSDLENNERKFIYGE